MTFSRGSRREAEITLTPLIDILFIVLLFLVLTSAFTEQSVLRVSLPGASSSEPTIEPVSVFRILIDAEGRAYLDDRLQTLDALRERIRALADPSRARIIIAADRAASHGSVVQVLDLVRQAGIVSVSIQTTVESQRTTSP